MSGNKRHLRLVALLVSMMLLMTSCALLNKSEDSEALRPAQEESEEEESSEESQASRDEIPEPKYRFAKIDSGVDFGKYWAAYELEFTSPGYAIDTVNADIFNTKTETELTFANSEKIIAQGKICVSKDMFRGQGHENDKQAWENDRNSYTFLLFSSDEEIIPDGNDIRIDAECQCSYYDESETMQVRKIKMSFTPNAKRKKLTLAKGPVAHGSPLFKAAGAYFVWVDSEVQENKSLEDEGTYISRTFTFRKVGGGNVNADDFGDNFRIGIYDGLTKQYQPYYPVLPTGVLMEVRCEKTDGLVFPEYRLNLGYFLGSDGDQETPYRIKETFETWCPLLITADGSVAFVK